MSLEKIEPKSEIDKSKRRHRTDDTVVATAEINGSSDILQHTKMDRLDEITKKPTELCLQSNQHLISSTTSSLADTPGDSGVLCLDSETSEATSQALMSHSLIGAEELTCDSQYDAAPSSSQDLIKSTSSSVMTRSDLDNQNVAVADDIVPELLIETHKNKSPVYENLPDVILKALEVDMVGTENIDKPILRSCEPKKSLSEDIVFRRRCRKKSQSGQSSQKKRVSFHEDILKNTKTDNIHIEHGFISYGPDSSYCDRFRQKNNINADRFSWCASGDRLPKYADDVAKQTMSDILTYGDSNNDKSGIFEYCQNYKDMNCNNKDEDNNNDLQPRLYGCDSNSSDSNFSCDSESSSSDSTSQSNKTEEYNKTVRKCDKTQKSYSCDTFENNNGHVAFMRKTYFSEADIDQSHNRTKKPLEVSPSSNIVKSVLKKKRYITTNIVEERKQNSRVLNILDTNNIIESLKNFYKNFNFNFTPERGLPETNLDMNNVVEALPSDCNHNKKLLSKSLDSGFQIDDDDDFVEINLNGQNLGTAKAKESTSVKLSTIDGNRTPNEGSPRHKLTLNMKGQNERNKVLMNKEEVLPPLSKYVVNCESTVYEHKGVSYSYVHDTFQTAFDTPKETFVPIPESTPVKDLMRNAEKPETDAKPNDMENSSRTSTPKRQFNKNIQEETESKNGLSKHLSSPKKQNVNRYSKKLTPPIQKSAEDTGQMNSDNASNTDNSTLKGAEDFNDMFFDSTSNQKLQSNKSALLNRYLKNVCQRKDLESKIKNNIFFRNKLRLEKHFPSIVYPFKDISKNYHVSAERMGWLIDKEVIENKRLSVRLLTADEPSYFDSFEDNVAIECNEKLRLKIFTYPSETLNRMMKVQSPYNMEDGSWTPLLVFITDYALYVASIKNDATEYDILCRLPHNELDAIAVGPEAHYLQVVDIAGNVACSIVTGESSLGARLVSSLEWSARTSPLRIQRPPALLPLTYRHLAAAVAREQHEKKIPEILFYGRACSGDAEDRLNEPPGAFAPPLEGYLMCRTDKNKRFEPYYFLLRAGVLHWGPHSPDGRTPLPNNIALRSVVGVRRHVDASRRPHCFEIALGDSTRLLLAAPDDPTASSWLQSLLLHAAQALEEKDGIKKLDPRARGPPPACTVLVTSNEVISLRDTLDLSFVAGAAAYLKERGSEALLKEYIEEMRTDIEILACGSIRNLTAFKIPDTDENWCCLEWSVCEARERGSGLALVLMSGAELERLISAVELAFCKLTSEPFPLSVVEASKSACSAAHSKFEAAWSHMLPQQ